MNLGQIDKNMLVSHKISDDVQWLDALDSSRFSLHGLITEGSEIIRLPSAVAEVISPKVAHLNRHTAGGRLCFVTDSPYIALHAKINGKVMSGMSWSGSGSFDLYIDGRFYGLFRSNPKGEQTELLYQLPQNISGSFPEGKHQMVLNFPAYAGVEDLQIGVKAGSTVRPVHPYKDTLPILYYGSSITQGACATRPGMMYQNYICRDTLVDYINLGFSGSAKGEPAMREYLATIDCSIFVCDWDHNLNDPVKLAAAHYPLYRTFRDAHPDTPIILISRPDFDTHNVAAANRQVIIDTYEKARAEGDQNIYFIDGETIFGDQHRDECTVDRTHPTDLGFYRFYQTLVPKILKLLK